MSFLDGLGLGSIPNSLLSSYAQFQPFSNDYYAALAQYQTYLSCRHGVDCPTCKENEKRSMEECQKKADLENKKKIDYENRCRSYIKKFRSK